MATPAGRSWDLSSGGISLFKDKINVLKVEIELNLIIIKKKTPSQINLEYKKKKSNFEGAHLLEINYQVVNCHSDVTGCSSHITFHPSSLPHFYFAHRCSMLERKKQNLLHFFRSLYMIKIQTLIKTKQILFSIRVSLYAPKTVNR